MAGVIERYMVGLGFSPDMRQLNSSLATIRSKAMQSVKGLSAQLGNGTGGPIAAGFSAIGNVAGRIPGQLGLIVAAVMAITLATKKLLTQTALVASSFRDLRRDAESFGGSAAQMDAWVDLMGGIGISATEVRSDLKELRKASTDAALGIGMRTTKAFAAYGIALTDAHGKARATVDIMRDVQAKIRSMPRIDAENMLQKFGMGNGLMKTLEFDMAYIEREQARISALAGQDFDRDLAGAERTMKSFNRFKQEWSLLGYAFEKTWQQIITSMFGQGNETAWDTLGRKVKEFREGVSRIAPYIRPIIIGFKLIGGTLMALRSVINAFVIVPLRFAYRVFQAFMRWFAKTDTGKKWALDIEFVILSVQLAILRAQIAFENFTEWLDRQTPEVFFNSIKQGIDDLTASIPGLQPLANLLGNLAGGRGFSIQDLTGKAAAAQKANAAATIARGQAFANADRATPPPMGQGSHTPLPRPAEFGVSVVIHGNANEADVRRGVHTGVSEAYRTAASGGAQ